MKKIFLKMEINDEIKALMKGHASLTIIKETNKIRCLLSGHEMPIKADAIRQYVAGKKYQKLVTEAGYDYSDYKQFLVPSNKKKHEQQLFCQLTWRHLNKQPHHIQRHVTGSRFQRALKRWKECQERGEKYQPRGNRQKRLMEDTDGEKKEGEEELMEDSSEEETEAMEADEEEMEDLYPTADFASDKEDSDSDFEFEHLENGADENVNAKKAEKRKTEQVTAAAPAKKAKKQKKKGAKGKLKKTKS